MMNPGQVQDSFWEWSIYNYFVQNYLEYGFHQNCQESGARCKEGDNFINHLQNYFIQFSKNRGNWITRFKFTAKQFKLWQSNKNVTPLNSSFFQLLAKLDLSEEHLIFIEFIITFFQFSALENAEKRKQLISTMRKLYFQYRIVLSYSDKMVDVGAPPSLVKFVDLIFSNYDSFKHILFDDTNYSLCPLRQLAVKCEFEHIYNQNVHKIPRKKLSAEKNRFNFEQFIQSPIKFLKTEEQKSSDLKSPISQITTQKQKNENVEQKQMKKNQQLQREKEARRESSDRMKNIICYKKALKNEIVSKIIKTTRHSNFKGIFIKKNPKIVELTKTVSTQETWSERKAMQQSKARAKAKVKKEEDDFSSFDFLCDKSF